jgi:hypothetical protein
MRIWRTVVLVGNAIKRMEVIASTLVDFASHKEIWTTQGSRPFARDVSDTVTSNRAEINRNGSPVRLVSQVEMKELRDKFALFPDSMLVTSKKVMWFPELLVRRLRSPSCFLEVDARWSFGGITGKLLKVTETINK